MSQLLSLIVKVMDAHHAENLKVFDFQDHSMGCDYFVIGSASNQRLAMALSEYVKEEVLKAGYSLCSYEGNRDSRWILLDFYDVVVHIFVGEERAVYGLDQLWADRPEVKIDGDL